VSLCYAEKYNGYAQGQSEITHREGYPPISKILLEFNCRQYTVGLLLKKPVIFPYFKGKGLVRALCG